MPGTNSCVFVLQIISLLGVLF